MNTPNEILINIYMDELQTEMIRQHKEEQRMELNTYERMERESYEC